MEWAEICKWELIKLPCFNLLTPVSDQDRISPYYIYAISFRQVMRIKKISVMGLLIDPIPNSPN